MHCASNHGFLPWATELKGRNLTADTEELRLGKQCLFFMCDVIALYTFESNRNPQLRSAVVQAGNASSKGLYFCWRKPTLVYMSMRQCQRTGHLVLCQDSLSYLRQGPGACATDIMSPSCVIEDGAQGVKLGATQASVTAIILMAAILIRGLFDRLFANRPVPALIDTSAGTGPARPIRPDLPHLMTWRPAKSLCGWEV
ncbi:uncharacterized protein B0I36DRAFT_92159 [Microdochium trichocladiopsis]|uniref:Uncharacterized protein n=1 Tax=Microdochium trichocladiopsis TaxID=1682393 RepID=A0A9P8YCI6_9PEZI|nr:uncharacterized protein B0I36DRAFT_92159 [Microdochium trichocladiopsis]KAH7035405.1 hypothetical protein B0I36DRAFT_92159 [Microdochium trichocladiopsis]